MRAKRSKQYRKLMHKFALNFGFRTPYQVLLDAAIIKDASAFSMHLGKNLESTLSGEIKPMITQCCIRHLYDVSASSEAEKRRKDAWIDVAKAAERRRCGHHELEQPLSALECIESVVDPKGSRRNRHRYVVASQHAEVRARMRQIAGVPLIYLKRSVMILEPMAGASEEVREREEKAKVRAGLKGRRGAQAGEKRKREDQEEHSNDEAAPHERDGGEQEASATKKRRVRGPKGPNPLSVKKSKKEKDKTPRARLVEDERPTTLRNATKQDPQASEKAMDAGLAVGSSAGTDRAIEGARKRKRKRKHGDGNEFTAVPGDGLPETT